MDLKGICWKGTIPKVVKGWLAWILALAMIFSGLPLGNFGGALALADSGSIIDGVAESKAASGTAVYALQNNELRSTELIYTLNASDMDLIDPKGEKTEDLRVECGTDNKFAYVITAGKNAGVDSSSKSITLKDGTALSFTKRINTQGSASKTHASVHFQISDQATEAEVTVVASTGTTGRIVGLWDKDGNVVDKTTGVMETTDLTEISFSLTAEKLSATREYYIGSVSSGIYIWYISVKEKMDSSNEEDDPADNAENIALQFTGYDTVEDKNQSCFSPDSGYANQGDVLKESDKALANGNVILGGDVKWHSSQYGIMLGNGSEIIIAAKSAAIIDLEISYQGKGYTVTSANSYLSTKEVSDTVKGNYKTVALSDVEIQTIILKFTGTVYLSKLNVTMTDAVLEQAAELDGVVSEYSADGSSIEAVLPETAAITVSAGSEKAELEAEIAWEKDTSAWEGFDTVTAETGGVVTVPGKLVLPYGITAKDEASTQVSIQVTVAGKSSVIVTGVGELQTEAEFANGVSAAEIAAALPKSVSLQLKDSQESEEALIQWEDSSLWNYTEDSLKEQVFLIKGVIEINDYLLAEGVSNEVFFTVTVKKTEETFYPEAGETNTYNFAEGEVVPKTNDKNSPISDIWSEDLFVHILSENKLYWHDTTHGLAVYDKDQFEVNVAGDAMITFTGCAYGKEATIVPTLSTGAITSENGQIFSGFGDGNDGKDVIFSYTGDATTIVFTVATAGETYLHKLTVKNEEKLENPDDKRIRVWDLTGIEESDTTLYNNQITMDTLKGIETLGTDGKFTAAGDVAFGSMALTVVANDRMYVVGLPNSYSGSKETVYSDGYKSNGYYYANGTGGNSRRCITISHINAGDKIVVYGGLSQNGPDEMHFVYLADPTLQDDAVSVTTGNYEVQTFLAEQTGTYRIYFTASSGKPVFSRVMHIPAVLVEGTIDTKTNQCEIGSSYTVQFTNNETGMVTKAVVASDGSYRVKLAPGYHYTAVLSGAYGYGFTLDSNKIAVSEDEILSGKADVKLVVEKKELVNVSGTIKGFASDYSRVSDLKVMLMPTESSMYDSISLTEHLQNLAYSVDVEKGVEYHVEISGVNDYIVADGGIFTANEDSTQDITVSAKPVYAVEGNYIDRDKNSFTASGITKLIFTNLEDEYVYEAEAAESGYRLSLRNGSYSIEAVGSTYQTGTHVVVEGETVKKDLMFHYQKPVVPIPSGVTDIYVGYEEKDCNYKNLTDAVAALNEAAPDSEEKRITVHIAPGEYREQLKITASYITFKNEEPDKGEVRITGYYGIGHEYYSLNADGFYDIERAYDKFDKITCTKSWGSTVYLSGGYFRAERIHFENSFNKYVTEEEIEDGAGLPNGELRTLQTDVTTKANTERAAAIVIGGSSGDNCDFCEFYKCSFSSSQDTLFVRRHAYFRDCFIEGNTDYIFGEAGITCVFDGCELSFAGYGGTASAAYITANRSEGNALGSIFRNCVITNKEGLSHTASYFGRPWDAKSRVTFFNTKVQDAETMIDAGWYNMSGNLPENANYAEWNTVSLDGAVLDTSGRVAGTVKDAAFAEAMQIEDFFEGWQPYYYYTYEPLTKESSTVEFTSAPVLSSTGDLEQVQIGDKLDVTYSIGENQSYDTSVIQWVRVHADGTKEVIRGYSALQAEHTYTITELDQDCTIQAVVKPETISGYQGTEGVASVTVGVVTSDKGLRKYEQEGYASAYSENGVTGGGIQTEDAETYYQTATAEEFLKALQAAKSSGKPSVIELVADIELGSKEIPNFANYSSIIKAYGAQPLTHPTLLQTGVSTLSFADMKDVTIFSLNGSSIKHANITMKNAKNIIIRNIKFDELWEWDEATNGDYDRNDWDYMTIDQGCDGIWIDHCTFFKAYDGVIDVKNPSPTANITISWCEFLPGSEENVFFDAMMNELAANAENYPNYQHMLEEGMTAEQIYLYAYGQKKTHLFGQSDDAVNAAGIQVTLANNYYKNSMDRMPRLRYGYTHVYNCIMDAQDLLTAKEGIANSEIAKKIVSNGASSTCGAQVLLENCFISGIQNVLNSGNGASAPGYINAVNSVYLMNGKAAVLEPKNNSTNEDQRVLITDESVFKSNLPYSGYILYRAEKLGSLVQPYAGAGKLNLTAVQWEKNHYNDDTMPDTGETDQPVKPTPDDSNDLDSEEDVQENAFLTSREESLAVGALGTSSIKEVAENGSGKLVVSTANEVVFVEKNGTLSKDKWQQVEGSWYFFGMDSKAVSGWLEKDGKWYHLNETNKKMETGWLKTADNKWYLLDGKNGDMKTGWQQTANGKWYLLDGKNGDMKTGWQQTADGKWYLLDGINGDMKTGWQQTADGKWYLLDSVNGDMKTGWQMVKGIWYYLTGTGAMAEDTVTPDGYTVGKDGAWTGR